MLHQLIEILYFFVPAYIANMSPVLVQNHFQWLAKPIDGGRMFAGKRILGDHKTWRGLVAGVVSATIAFELQRLAFEAGYLRDLTWIDFDAAGPQIGALMGLGAIVGDAVKSFFKRRVDIAPGHSWPVFDQLDFLVGATLFVSPFYLPALQPLVLCLPIIMIGSLLTTTLGYWFGLKESWI